MMEELFKQFVKERIYLLSVSPKTVVFYNQAWTSFRKVCPGDTITNNDLFNYLVSLKDSGLKPVSINTYSRALNAFFNWLYEAGHTAERLRIKKLKVEQSVIKTVTDAQLQSIIRFKPKTDGDWRTHTVAVLLIDTGMRIDEALGLLLSNVNLEQLQVTVSGKGQKERIIPISFEMRKRLWLYISRKRKGNPSPYLFPTRTYGRLEYHNYRRDLLNMAKAIGLSGVRVNPHGFRHYFSVNYLRRGGDIYRLSRILGHTSVKTTEIYLRSMGIEVIQEAHRQFSPLSVLR